MRVIAIDPGYERLGIAILDKEKTGKEILAYSSCFQTPKTLPHHKRLAMVSAELSRLISEFKPEALATETLFFSKNTTTAMLVAEARGVILSTASLNGLDILELSPSAIKIAVTGHGRSDKQQVMAMVPRLLQIGKKIEYDDEYDAIAIGLAFFASYRSLSTR